MNLTVTLYANGFIVDDDNAGFRTFSDPANRQFLEDLKKGIMPKELEDKHRDQIMSNAQQGIRTPVRIRLENKSQEDYKPPAYIPISHQIKVCFYTINLNRSYVLKFFTLNNL